MKIVAGMGSIDEYIPYSLAGADEVFIGYVPDWWNRKYSTNSPLNRREVLYYNVQIGSLSELRIVSDMARKYGTKIVVALNALHYRESQFEEIIKVIQECRSTGTNSFIVGDYALLVYLNGIDLGNIEIHISGEMAQVNHLMVRQMWKLGASRIIFHRKVNIEDMKKIIVWCKNNKIDMEFEAFVLNEKCHFTGAYCNSLHCDELAHLCHLPFRLGNVDNQNYSMEKETCAEQPDEGQRRREQQSKSKSVEIDESIPGGSGCGLCALWQLRDAGVTHIKLVSRGNYMDDTIDDIGLLKRALDILEESENEYNYKNNIKYELFDEKCSGNCYYFI